MNNRLLTLLIAVLLIAFAVAMWSPQNTPEALPTTPSSRAAALPDIEGSAVQFRQLRPDGTLHYLLDAQSIRQFNDEQLTRMVTPFLKLLSLDQPPWDVRAEHGYIRKVDSPVPGTREDVVFLREKVELKQKHPKNGLVTLRSKSFYVYPARQYAETFQGVIIDTQVGRTRAAGMSADLAGGLLKLTSSPKPGSLSDEAGLEAGNPDDGREPGRRDTKQRVHTIVLPEQFKKS